MDKARRRPFARSGYGTRHRHRVAAGLDRGEQQRHRRFALALQHAIDRTIAMRDDRSRRERGAVTADADEAMRKPGLRRLGEIDDLGHVRQIVAAKCNDVGTPLVQHPEIGAVILDLQIDQPDLMPGAARRLGDEFEPNRLEPQKDLRIMEHSGIDAE
jgi:hypothetical protein